MKRIALTSAAILIAASSAAYAQSNSLPNGNPDPSAPVGAANGAQGNTANLRQQLTNNLQQSGFTDVKIMPDSFLVQAKDKSGHPMTMFVSPDSITEVSATGSNGRNSDNSNAQIADASNGSPNDSNARTSAGGMFTTIPVKDDLSSQLIGLDVYNNAKQDIGTIKDVAFDSTGVKAYILGVGGLLGMGDHYVAVRPAALTLSFRASDKKWHAAMDTNAAQLKAAPEYKYPTNS